MQALETIDAGFRKTAVPQVQSGDTVRVHQLIKEGNKQRVQVFEGVVIRTHRSNSLTAVITVRRIASGVGVEKTFLLHSPNVQKVEVVRRSKVRRNFLSYLRGRRGKSARLQELGFDREAVNVKEAPKVDPKEAEVAKLAAQQADDDAKDAEVTEIPDSVSEEPVESTEEVVKEENKEAADQDEPKVSDDPGEEGDEGAAPAEEVNEGLDKAAKETDE